MSGSTTQVTQTAHWTAIIATIAVGLCLLIAMGALAAVIIRDGNTQLVLNAEGILGNIGTGLAVTLALLVAGPQAVSAFVGRFQGSGGAAAGATSATPAAPTPPAA